MDPVSVLFSFFVFYPIFVNANAFFLRFFLMCRIQDLLAIGCYSVRFEGVMVMWRCDYVLWTRLHCFYGIWTVID